MNALRPSRAHWLIVAVLGLSLACRVGDIIAQNNEPASNTPTRSRPTFTIVARLLAEPTNTPPPPTATRPPTSTPRPPTRIPTATKTLPPAAPPPTPDPYAGFYYRPANKNCTAATNTRIQGTVIDNGAPKNGVKVRVALCETCDPVVNDFISGTDPTDYKRSPPELVGKYQFGIAEGQLRSGNWWVFVMDDALNRISPAMYVPTDDKTGCNTWTVDFVH